MFFVVLAGFVEIRLSHRWVAESARLVFFLGVLGGRESEWQEENRHCKGNC